MRSKPVPITGDLKLEEATTISIKVAVLPQAKPFFERWKRAAKSGS